MNDKKKSYVFFPVPVELESQKLFIQYGTIASSFAKN